MSRTKYILSTAEISEAILLAIRTVHLCVLLLGDKHFDAPKHNGLGTKRHYRAAPSFVVGKNTNRPGAILYSAHDIAQLIERNDPDIKAFRNNTKNVHPVVSVALGVGACEKFPTSTCQK